MEAKNIDEVIEFLEQIIQTSKKEESPLGYFAALYQRVTLEVQNKLGARYFEDDERMAKLDTVFANRYLDAYSKHRSGDEITKSWSTTFEYSKNQKLIVLQHLLLGMNAHINLDLGIAAAEISNTSTINNLENDFNKINEILASLVDEVQESLTKVWPILSWVLRKLKGIDDHLVNFSMGIARDGAWKFAKELAVISPQEREQKIRLRDTRISELTDIIVNQKLLKRLLFRILRFSERGSVSQKIESLEKD